MTVVAWLNFANPIGLLALLSIVPLIILYLIRPRPKPMAVPSLMFFMRNWGVNKLTSFLRQITRDWLFLIQLLALILASLAVAQPYTFIQKDIASENTVIVMDVSASMSALEGVRTRLDIAVAKAKESLGSKNTVILAKQIPHIGLKDATAAETSEFLNTVRQTQSPTRLGDAIILAGEALAGGEGRVVVLSDFINTGGQDPETSRAVLQARGIVVEFINVAGRSEKQNIGFIDMAVDKDEVTLYVKNYNRNQRTASITAGENVKELAINANSAEPFTFKPPAGVTKVELRPFDDFNADNTVYISAPAKEVVPVLLITNNKSDFLANALTASEEVELTVTEPPVIKEGDFDVIIINNINPAEIISGTFENIKKQVEKGTNLVIHAQDDMSLLGDFKGLLKLKLEGTGDRQPVLVDQLNRFTKNIEFGNVDRYHIAKPADDKVLTILSAEKSPLVAYYTLGAGKVIYYGILETASDFKFSPGYPIFWTELLRFMTERQDIKALNFKTDQSLLLDEVVEIKTPSKTVKEGALQLEEAGIYKLPDRIIASNLLNEKESNINGNFSAGQKSIEYQLQPVKEKKKYSFEIPLLIIAAILLLFEVVYIKLRGDL